MTVREIVSILDARVLAGGDRLDTEIRTACGSDMMSDVLAFAKDSSALITGLVNPQAVRTAQMMDMKCVVFVRGKLPDAEMIRLAEDLGVILLSTRHRMFMACGLLYGHGLGVGEGAGTNG